MFWFTMVARSNIARRLDRQSFNAIEWKPNIALKSSTDRYWAGCRQAGSGRPYLQSDIRLRGHEIAIPQLRTPEHACVRPRRHIAKFSITRSNLQIRIA